MTDDDLRHQLLDALTRQGGSAGNKTLRETLAWDEGTYDRVVAQLKALGKVVPGRGRGGSLSLPGFDGAGVAEPAPTATDPEMDRFLQALNRAGGAAGNVTLRTLLNWDEDTYFRVQKALVALGNPGLKLPDAQCASPENDLVGPLRALRGFVGEDDAVGRVKGSFRVFA